MLKEAGTMVWGVLWVLRKKKRINGEGREWRTDVWMMLVLRLMESERLLSDLAHQGLCPLGGLRDYREIETCRRV